MNEKKINVTKTYLPPLDEYNVYIKKIWDNNWITNHGEFSLKLEEQLKKFLGIKNLVYVSNGTVALEVAIKALNLTGEIITTPYSYVATTTSILWVNCKPVFVDIEEPGLCINPLLIEKAITPNTTGILATHVYGNSCNIEKLEEIARKHNLKVIYDAAHCFGVKYKGKSILSYGDISTISFHATKIFHTVEGGAVVTNDDELNKKIFLLKSFGHIGDEYFSLGINAKNSEFHAAMGLCILPKIKMMIEERKKIFEFYQNSLSSSNLQFIALNKELEYNYSYFPAVFSDENVMFKTKRKMEENNIFTRRYFYPSLNTLPYIKADKCPVSEDIASRVLCLPLFNGLEMQHLKKIVNIIKDCI